MKDFQKLWFCIIFLLMLFMAGANFCVFYMEKSDADFYKVEVKRMGDEIEKFGINQVNRQKYPTIKQVKVLSLKEETKEKEKLNKLQMFMKETEYTYQIRKINGDYYRFDVEIGEKKSRKDEIIIFNIILSLIAIDVLMILWYVKRKIIVPFERIRQVPYELAKGNITIPLTVEKNKYFGDFVWGLNLLKEHLEQQRKWCLSMQKEKSTLLLSLSHDIKTPLSAIKLYAKALSRNLYNSKEKEKEVAENINRKADEIEAFLIQIMQSTSENFIEFTVKEEEFYLSEVVHKLETYYRDKLAYQHIK
ncbi:MAG: sensor histidine kinase, partial [Lachnospiraceae bacterium]|nr:sensor histidine kinase [Lachnospiraceae bacterium]